MSASDTTEYTGLGTTINVRAAGTTATVGFNRDVVLVGGYDVDNGSANPNEVELITDQSAADALFGSESELAKQYYPTSLNASGNIYGIGVEEQSSTHEETDASTALIPEAPVFDPTVNTEHEITVQDDTGSDLNVEISYADFLETPDSGAVVNPITGHVEFEGVGTYTIDYDYGDYTTAIQIASREDVRFVIVCSESTDVADTLFTELEDEAQDIRMKRGVVGAQPNIDSLDIADYDYTHDNQRLVAVAPARGVTNNDAQNDARTVGAVGGAMASQPLGESLTYDTIAGFEEFDQMYRPSRAQNFDRVTAMTDEFEIVEAVTTSSVEEFSDVYKVEIIDTVVQGLYEVGREYAGGANTPDDRDNLETDTRNLLSNYASMRPPLLAAADGSTPYNAQTKLGDTDDQTELFVGVDPLDVMKEVIINLNVGTVVTYEGATVA